MELPREGGGGGGVRVLRASGRQNIWNQFSGTLFYLMVFVCIFFFLQDKARGKDADPTSPHARVFFAGRP